MTPVIGKTVTVDLGGYMGSGEEDDGLYLKNIISTPITANGTYELDEGTDYSDFVEIDGTDNMSGDNIDVVIKVIAGEQEETITRSGISFNFYEAFEDDELEILANPDITSIEITVSTAE